MAVDARPNKNRQMSNQATGITIRYSYNQAISFEENARKVHKKVYRKLQNPASRYFILRLMALFAPPLVDSLLMHKYGLYDNPVSKKLAKAIGYTAQGKKVSVLQT